MRTLLTAPPHYSFRRTVYSHGWCDLPPFKVSEKGEWVATVVAVPGGGAHRMTLHEERDGVVLETPGNPGLPAQRALRAAARRMLALDLDVSAFHAAVANDPRYGWIATSGTGRFLRGPTMWEDVVKLVLTTNCSWAVTKKMVTTLVDKYGEQAEDGARSFPTPEKLARIRETTYRNVVKAGYRSPLLQSLSKLVATGKVDVAAWDADTRASEIVKKEMLALPGVGPYVAENLLKFIGRPQGLALDSWVRAKYSRLHHGGRKVTDRTIHRSTARLGAWAGLALWFEMTRDWFDGDHPTALWATLS
jgi:3-methyladenine DNA glycosylase/8-oxoguanine DNA glycosylase